MIPAATRVLVVDDSAVARQTLSAVLSRDEGFEVQTAPDPLIAMQKMERVPPDVIVLDLEMPRMNGMTFLRKLMASQRPLPVVVCSGLGGGATAVRALEEGAVAVVEKPRLDVRGFLFESAVLLVDTVRGAAQARLAPRRAAPQPKLTADVVLPPRPATTLRTEHSLVAIGASTGGTEALRTLLTPMPLESPPILVVQHMPEGFTRAFADRLDHCCAINVREAVHGDVPRTGLALVAPGNRHMILRRQGSRYRVELSDGPLVSRHRPSVDVLFRSAAQAAGPNAIGLILTGMGDDGAAGLLELRQAGAATLAQDEESCTVFGMPREAIARGAVDEVLPLDRLAPALLTRAGHQSTVDSRQS